MALGLHHKRTPSWDEKLAFGTFVLLLALGALSFLAGVGWLAWQVIKWGAAG